MIQNKLSSEITKDPVLHKFLLDERSSLRLLRISNFTTSSTPSPHVRSDLPESWVSRCHRDNERVRGYPVMGQGNKVAAARRKWRKGGERVPN
jgi:hypothetical protein